MKSVSWLIEYVKAQKGKPYWFGTFGQTGSAALYQSKKKQYPSQYTASDFPSQYGKKVHDCSGLIKGALWCSTVDGAPSYKASEDYSANKFYTMASAKGPITSIPDIAGLLVFKGTDKQKSHIGVYIGNGRVIEAKGHKYGVVESALSSGWKYWGKCNLFSYTNNAATAPAPAHAPVKPAQPSGYTAAELQAARDCIRGRYGNGAARRHNLQVRGFDYARVQGLVNKILRGEIK
jgi:hypothetical protein